jgi:hypothetical protein
LLLKGQRGFLKSTKKDVMIFKNKTSCPKYIL